LEAKNFFSTTGEHDGGRGFEMNENTLVSIHGYEGDAHQIRCLLPYNLHHLCPVVVLSPVDSMITPAHLTARPEVQYRFAGKRAYIGRESLYRQRDQLRELLKFPHQFFLMNDSDSVCLSPKIPQYLYASPGVVWSNVVSDEMHHRAADYPFPRVAFQPPYFMDRTVLQKLVDAAARVSFPEEPQTPYIDWVMMRWTMEAGLPYRGFPDGHSCPTNVDNVPSCQQSLRGVREGGHVFLHSIKTADMLRQHVLARLYYLKKPH
jgi:hypothetical protein